MNDPFDHWFGRRLGAHGREDPFDRFFAAFQERLDALQRLQQAQGDGRPEDEPGRVRSWSYGYRMTTGPDGEPQVETWGQGPDGAPLDLPTLPGNARRAASAGAAIRDDVGTDPAAYATDGRHATPHTTSFVDPDAGMVTVKAELPGVRTEDIQVDAAGDRIHIHVNAGPRRYDTEVQLDAAVDDDALTTSYRNGILEVRAPVRTPPEA